MDRATIEAEYARLDHSYNQLKEEVLFIVREALTEKGITFHLVEGRVKSIHSLIKKVEQNDIEEPFEEIHDICGVRIIALFKSDIEECGKVIEDIFAIEDVDKKITKQPDSQFDYTSDHYIASLPSRFSGPRYDGIKGLQFEIQLRTIATHAWATISHHLDYKSEVAIPSHLRRDFYALNALFYIADSHFEQFFQASQAALQLTVEKSQGAVGIGDEEINRDTLTTYLSQEFPERQSSGPESVSEIINEMVSAGYRTISELDQDLQNSRSAFAEYEKDHPPGEEVKFSTVGVVRISLLIANPDFLDDEENASSPRRPYDEYRQYL